MDARTKKRLATLAVEILIFSNVAFLTPFNLALPALAQVTGQLTRPTVTPLPQTLPRITVTPTPLATAPLRGWVDLHAHPMGNLGFGGKMLYGGVDVGSWLPADPNCNQNVRAASEPLALGADNSTHGGPNLVPVNNTCGNLVRANVISGFQGALGANNPPSNSVGYPTFVNWPTWNDLLHQRMWVEWIRRAYQGGLRVMVALAVNNKTLGDVALAGIQPPPVGSSWQTLQGRNSDLPTDDRTSADIQISEIQLFVSRHSDFMEVARSSADVYRIVSANKLAVVVGMEIDHIGNFGQVFYSNGVMTPPGEWQADWNAAAVPPADTVVRAEIDRLYSEGVRYIFPIHLLDNAFGGTATYVEMFNLSTLRESGHIWNLVCTNDPRDNINWTYNNGNTSFNSLVVGPLNVSFPTIGVTEGACPTLPTNQLPYGQKNARGLTPSGVVAIKEMMRLGMLIDLDHASEVSEDQMLQLACYGDTRTIQPAPSVLPTPASPFVFTLPCPYGYPLNSGHSGLRGAIGGGTNERALRADQYAMIGQLHGMAGVGSAKLTADWWLKSYDSVIQGMGGDPSCAKPYNPASPVTAGSATSSSIAAGFGTDFDGLEFAMPPRQGVQETVGGPQYAQYSACMKGPTCRTVTSTVPGSGPVAGGQVQSHVVTTNSCMAACRTQYPNAFQQVWAPAPPNVQYTSAMSPTALTFPQTIPRSADGNKSWNYNTDGVAHYGMLWDFLQDVASLPGGAAMVNNNFMYGADYFYRTWQRAEVLSKNAPQ